MVVNDIKYSQSQGKNKQTFPYCFFFLIFLFLWIIASRIEQIDALDLHRYYDYTEESRNWSTLEIIEYAFNRSVDFIYYIILHCALFLNIPLNAITALIVTIYYGLIYSTIKSVYNGKIAWYVVFVTLFLAPLTSNVAISRNLTAFMFLYAAVLSFLRHYRILTLLFLLLSLFTHFSVIMYLAVLIVSYFLQNRHIKRWVVLLILSIAMIGSLIIPSYLIDIFTFITVTQDVRASTYGDLSVGGMGTWSTVNYGIKVPMLFGLFYSVVLLLINKKQGFVFWILLILTMMLAFFINSSQMFSDRTMMFLPVFWGINIAYIYKYGTGREKRKIRLISLTGIIPVLLHLWALRPIYLFFI